MVTLRSLEVKCIMVIKDVFNKLGFLFTHIMRERYATTPSQIKKDDIICTEYYVAERETKGLLEVGGWTIKHVFQGAFVKGKCTKSIVTGEENLNTVQMLEKMQEHERTLNPDSPKKFPTLIKN